MPGIGPRPKYSYNSATNKEAAKKHYIIDKWLSARQRQGGPVVIEHNEPMDLTVGQIMLLNHKEISVIMADDLGKYELALGPDRRIIKRRL